MTRREFLQLIALCAAAATIGVGVGSAMASPASPPTPIAEPYRRSFNLYGAAPHGCAVSSSAGILPAPFSGLETL